MADGKRPSCHWKWGDSAGHHAAGEIPCLRCAYLSAARQRIHRVRYGGQIRLDGPLLSAFAAHCADGLGTIEALERTLIDSAPSVVRS